MVAPIQPPLGLIVIACIPITFFSAKLIMREIPAILKEQADVLGALNGFVQENLRRLQRLKICTGKSS